MENTPFDGDIVAQLDKDLDALSPAELDAYITARTQIVANVEHQLLSAYATLQRRGLHESDGCQTLGNWIQTRTFCEHRTAAEQARVANSLQDLPDVRARYAAGELHYDQVRQLTKFVTADTDTEWAERAPDMTAHKLGVMAKRHKPRPKERDDKADSPSDDPGDRDDSGKRDPAEERSLTYGHLADGRFRYSITLPGLDGAMTLAALQRQAERYGPDDDTAKWAPRHERLADAFFDLVTAAKPSKSGDRATVVVHVPHRHKNQDTTDGDGYGAYVDYPFTGPISDDDIDLLGCHGRIQVSIDDLDGHPVGIGRLSRHWPPWLFNAIWHRDGGSCRFPGCSNTIGLAVHHEEPWSQGGRTDYGGGYLICPRHHRKRHKGKWRSEGDPRCDLTFYRPDGTVFDPKPGPIPPDMQTRLHDLGYGTDGWAEAG